jgi:predicted permease
MMQLMTATRSAVRALTRAPIFFSSLIALISLGGGASLALLLVVDTALWRALPFPQGERLVRLQPVVLNPIRPIAGMPWPFFRAVQATSTIERIAFARETDVTPSLNGVPETWRGCGVSEHMLEVLGVHPIAGRLLGPVDFGPTTVTPVLITDGLWHRRFGADPQVMGRLLPQVNGSSVQIVGVIPDGTLCPTVPDAVRPSVVIPQGEREYDSLPYVPAPIARLRAGADIPAVERELLLRLASVRGVDALRNVAMRIVPFRTALFGNEQRSYEVLATAGVALLLATACTVSLLVTVRARHLRHRAQVSLALGASGVRLGVERVMQLLVIGGVALPCTAAIAFATQVGLSRLLPAATWLIIQSPIEARYVIATSGALLLVIVCASVTSLIEVRRAQHHDLLTGLRGDTADHRMHRGALIAFQIALVTVLLVNGGLMVRSLMALARLPLGVQVDHVVVFEPRQLNVNEPVDDWREFWFRVVEDLNQQPGVAQAAVGFETPMGTLTGWASLRRPGAGDDWTPDLGSMMPVSRQYFATMGIPVVAGRTFDADEERAGDQVGLINETGAHMYFGSESPLGRTVQTPWFPHPFRVIGLVGDTRFRPDVPSIAMLYVPMWRVKGLPMKVLVRLHGDDRAALSGVTDHLRRMDATVVWPPGREYRAIVARWRDRQAFWATLLGLCSGLTTALVVLSTAAIIGYTVIMRHREVGIRLALGATRHRLAVTIGRAAIVPALIGIVVGSVAATFVAARLQSDLFETAALDPLVHVQAAAVVLGTLLTSAYVPSIWATRMGIPALLRRE